MVRKILIIGAVMPLIIAGAAIYSLDHGLYIGTSLYEWPAYVGVCDRDPIPDIFRRMCDEGTLKKGPPTKQPKIEKIEKRCRYVFITGVSEITAHDGFTEGDQPPFKGYCTLFAK
jgi:hypothetical protein